MSLGSGLEHRRSAATLPSYSYKVILCLWMGTLKYCLRAVKPTKEATAVSSLELQGLSELSRESRGKSVWMVGVEKIDVKDIEVATVFTQANYMCNEWLMNPY